MRNIYIFILVLFGFSISAQDNIIQKDGSEIKCKVIEVQLEVIKYKRFDNLDGPVYSISKNQLFMIQYENGSRDVFDTNISDSIDSIIADTIQKITHKKDSIRIRNYLFLNGTFRTGQFGPTTTALSSSSGVDLELGAVFYFAPEKMPKNFGVGLNVTFLNVGIAQRTYASSINNGPLIFPYAASVGPHFSYLYKRVIFDIHVKPGMSIVNINDYYRPSFLVDVGFGFRFKAFMVGLSGHIMPTIDAYDGNRYLASYNYSCIRIRVGVALGISKKKKNEELDKKM